MRIILLFVAGCVLVVMTIVLVVIASLWFESNRPAPERKPDPTVLEIGE